MTIYGIILFALGVIFVMIGAGLIVYYALKKPESAKAQADQGILKVIFDFILGLLKILVDLVGQDRAGRAGLILVVIGIALIVLPFLVL